MLISQLTYHLRLADQIPSPQLKHYLRNIADKFKMPKFSVGHNSNNGNCLEDNQFIYLSFSIGRLSFKTLAKILTSTDTVWHTVLVSVPPSPPPLRNKKKSDLHSLSKFSYKRVLLTSLMFNMVKFSNVQNSKKKKKK